ncbi:MAG: cell envelope biogenesis protein TolA, partial [Planctomycetota bacterium]
MTDDEPKPIPRKTPKKREGPSMREQILARRRSESSDSTEAAKPAPAKQAAAKPAAKKSAAAKPAAAAAAKPAAAKPAAPVRRGAGRSSDG